MKIVRLGILVLLVGVLVLIGLWGGGTQDRTFAELYGEQYPGDLIPGITTIITTAPQPSIPSSRIIMETVKSLDAVPFLRDSSIIIGFDGNGVLRPGLDSKCTSEFSETAYNEYKENVKKAATAALPHVTFVEMEERSCLTGLLYRCMRDVNTEFVNVMQQDLMIVKTFDARKIIDIMSRKSDMSLVRYSLGTNRFHEDYAESVCGGILPSKSIIEDGVLFTVCSQWSDNNHIAKTKHYREVVWPGTKPLSFMEHDLVCYKESIWYIGDIDDGFYVEHLDGRTSER